MARIVSGLSRGKAFMDAVRYGMAAGAAAVTSDDSQLCRRDDVEELYRHLTSNSEG